MPFLLRCITQARWLKDTAAPFLARGDVPADPFGDLRTKENKFSVWLIEDDQLDLQRVICAIAATREKPDKFDYLLFDLQMLSGVNIEISQTVGDTPDKEINISFHHDLIDLSGLKLFNLVRAIMESDDFETIRLFPRQVTDLLLDAVRSSRLPLRQLNSKLQEKLGPLLAANTPD